MQEEEREAVEQEEKKTEKEEEQKKKSRKKMKKKMMMMKTMVKEEEKERDQAEAGASPEIQVGGGATRQGRAARRLTVAHAASQRCRKEAHSRCGIRP
jgi:hypothetical protein